MILRILVIQILAISLNQYLNAQGVLLIISSEDCEITIDGDGKEQLFANKPKKIELLTGEHLIQAKSQEGKELSEFVSIESEKQKILKISFDKPNVNEVETIGSTSSNEKLILVAELNLTLSGGINAVASEELGEYVSNTELYYAFEEGDEIFINGDIVNKKGKFIIQLIKYPENTPIYSRQGLRELNDHRINIQERSIYILRIGTSALFDKKIRLRIERKPFNGNKASFVTTVQRNFKFKAVNILKPSYHFINSTSNETWKGGTNEIVIPITPPKEAVEWYYIISASRNQDEINSNLSNISLLGDVTKALNGLNPATTAINLGLKILTQPPGSNYCDVYLLDYGNQSLFSNDNQFSYVLEGSRTNVKSATVDVKCCTGKQYYLGIENNDTYNGIHIGIEAVAVLKEEYLSLTEE